MLTWLEPPLASGPPFTVPHPEPVPALQYSSASWWKPCPPSCAAAPPASRLAPDHNIHDEPVFHHSLLLSMMACQSTMKVEGRLAVSAAIAACVSHSASRESVPGFRSPQLKAVGPAAVGVPAATPLFALTILSAQMFTNLR